MSQVLQYKFKVAYNSFLALPVLSLLINNINEKGKWALLTYHGFIQLLS